MNRVLGIALVVFAVAIAVVPMFTDCQSQGKAITLANGNQIPMKCHWTGKAELAVGIPLAGVGVVMIASRRKEYLRTTGIVGGILGISAILVPNTLIGVCTNMTALCNTVMQPTLTILGSLTIVGSVIGLVLSRKNTLQ